MKVSPKLLILEILAFLAFASLAGAGFLSWRLSRGPIDLEAFRPNIERSLSEARGGAPVKIASIALEWSRDRARVEAAAHGVTALDAHGRVVSQADRAVISFNAAALLSGQLKTERIRLENGRAAVVRSKDGVWSLADVVFLREPAKDKPFNFKDLNWSTLATPIRALVSAGALSRVEFVNFGLDVKDESAGLTWSANPVRGIWTARADGIAFDLDMKLVGAPGLPNTLHLALSADGQVRRAKGRLALEGVDPVTLARMLGYAGEALTSGAPGDAVMSLEASETEGVKSARLAISGARGAVKVGDLAVAIQDLNFDAAYDPSSHAIALTSFNIASDRLAGSLTGSADLSGIVAGDATKPIGFKLLGKDLSISATPIFEASSLFKSLAIEGTAAQDVSKITLSSFQLVTGGLSATGGGELVLGGPPGQRKFGMKLKATGSGEATPAQVVEFWPVALAGGARTWVKDHIKAGKATKASVNVDFAPGALDRGYLLDPELQVEFYATDASVSFLDDFPPITGVAGLGHVKGNSMSIEATTGKMAGWTLDEAKVTMPHFNPRGAIMEVAASGRGDLRSMMRVLDASKLKVGEKYGLKVDEMAGTGSTSVTFKRPMLDEVRDADLMFDVKGGFMAASVPGLAAGFGLSGSDVRYEATPTSLAISGAGKFGPAPVVFDWKEGFPAFGADGASSSELNATAKATPDLLNAFGFAARSIMQGEADLELHASGAGRDFTSINAKLDFTRAALDVPEIGWKKPYDVAASGSFRYGRESSGNAVVTGDVRADGLELVADGKINAKNEIQSAAIERIYSRGSMDLRGDLSRKADGAYRLSLLGPFLDASPWMDSFLTMSDGQKDAASGAVPTNGPPFFLQLTADRLKLREDAELAKADVALELDARGPRSGHVRGTISAGKKVDVEITPAGTARKVMIKSDDAGFGARVLIKTNYLVGGSLNFDGSFEGSKGQAKVTMAGVRLRNAPLLAQIFSLASLRGLTDVLNGDGVLFTKVDAPIVIDEGRIVIPGLRASGPAMGLTARGWVAPGKSELSLDGVLVPSFGVNSALGGLPVIGDLFVSRQGEGLFAPTYSVRGTFTRARVSLNPVAALTPGLLRRIFENPTEAPPAEASPPTAAPPAAPPAASAPPVPPPASAAQRTKTALPELTAHGPAPLTESRN